MFKQGQVYKAKVELSQDLMGFGRATVIAIDSRSIFLQIKSSKGEKLKIQTGAKIWLVGSSQNNRFNGLWCSEVKGQKIINGVTALECRLPRFEQTSQKRAQSRTQVNAVLEIEGDEWKDLAGKLFTRNISRLGLGFSALGVDLTQRFTAGKEITLTFKVGDTVVSNKHRVINSRFNWLLHRTDIGAEIIDMNAEAVENLERVIVLLIDKAKTRAQLSDSGSLARWVKAGKDNLSFVKTSELQRPNIDMLQQAQAGSEASDTDAPEEPDEFDELEEDLGME